MKLYHSTTQKWILAGVCLVLLFSVITLTLLFTGGVAALPIIGAWFASMSPPVACVLAGLSLTGIVFITALILELGRKAMMGLYNAIKTPVETSATCSPRPPLRKQDATTSFRLPPKTAVETPPAPVEAAYGNLFDHDRNDENGSAFGGLVVVAPLPPDNDYCRLGLGPT